MRHLTQRQKVEGYDSLAAEKSTYELAVYDLVNHRFSLAETYTARRIRDLFTCSWDHGAYTVSMSWRSMPLFLVRYLAGEQAVQCWIYTEDQIQDMARNASCGDLYPRLLLHARNELVRKRLAKEEKTA